MMWTERFIALLYAGVLATSKVLSDDQAPAEMTVCEHYDQDCEKRTHSPSSSCYPTPVMRACDPPDVPGKPMHCFALWHNVSGVVTAIVKGCWVDCEAYSENCVGYPVAPVQDGYYCCCNTIGCNRNMSWSGSTWPTTLLPPFRNNSDQPVTLNFDNKVVNALLMSLLPLLILAVVITLAFWLWRRHQASYVDMNHSEPLLVVQSPTSDIASVKSVLPIELRDLCARGRFGLVYSAVLHNQVVAVKVLPISERQSWQNECAFYGLLPLAGHSNILHFYGAEQHSSDLWLISEYHDRGSLQNYLKSAVVSWPELVNIATSFACGLSFLHGGMGHDKHYAVAHRDIKSQNILLKHDKTVCIADFGLALILDDKVVDVRAQVGTRRYMAPEVLDGSINFSNEFILKIDVFASALVLWEVVSRCSAINGPVDSYRLPYQDEVGEQPTLEEMQSVVVTQKMRPQLPDCNGHKGLEVFCSTIEDSWDQDPEARLTAECIHERMLQLGVVIGRSSAQSDDSTIASSHSSDDALLSASQSSEANDAILGCSDSVSKYMLNSGYPV